MHESRLEKAIGGTIAIHLLLALIGDAIVMSYPQRDDEPARHVELVDIEPPPLMLPPPPPVPVPDPVVQQKPVEQRVQKVAQPRTAPPITQPPPTQDTTPDPNPSGGAPPVTTEFVGDIPTGVGVQPGPRNPGRIGRGGSGTGTGAGSGAGSSDEPPKPVSVATIKQRALPKGDFSYFDASKDYPPEAKSLGIEGVIKVRLVVDEQGKVKSSVLLNRLGHGLDELALERAKKIEFVPALDTDDKPVTSIVVWTFNMTLPK